MNAIWLHQAGLKRNGFERKVSESRASELSRLDEAGAKGIGIKLTQVWRDFHRQNQCLCASVLGQLHELDEIVAQLGYWIPAEPIVAAQLDNDNAGLVAIK
jgi:hypothetical protein